MALLITQSNEIFLDRANINQYIFPVIFHCFPITPEAQEISDSRPHTEKARLLYEEIPVEFSQFCTSKGLQATVAVNFNSDTSDSVKERIKKSQIPHINPGSECHFIFSGGLIFYFIIEDTVFNVVASAGDCVFLPEGIPHWIKMTNDFYLTLVSFHSEEIETFHKKVVYDESLIRATLI